MGEEYPPFCINNFIRDTKKIYLFNILNNLKKMITLVIVDCQNDFISGSMSVKGAKEALDSIKNYISKNKKEICKILFTVDWHPYNHSSFKRYGGQWPSHCVQYTPGACIESKLLKFIQSLAIDYEVVPKGMIEEVEEYGAFSEIEYVQSFLGDRYYFQSVAEADANSTFVVCGIAGDYCVKETIKNMLQEDIIPDVLLSGIASIDDGSTIKLFIKDNGLNIVK